MEAANSAASQLVAHVEAVDSGRCIEVEWFVPVMAADGTTAFNLAHMVNGLNTKNPTANSTHAQGSTD